MGFIGQGTSLEYAKVTTPSSYRRAQQKRMTVD